MTIDDKYTNMNYSFATIVTSGQVMEATEAYSEEVALKLFREHGGMLRAVEARRLGVHQETIRRLTKRADLEPVARGLYRLSNMPIPEHVDLAVIAKLVPDGVVCLVSALAFHEMTTHIPHEVFLMLPIGHSTPKLDWPPIRTFRTSGPAYAEGIEIHNASGVELRVYSPAKTVADCFKFRNKIGTTVAVEALRAYLERDDADLSILLHYARMCRVELVIRPYLEAMQ